MTSSKLLPKWECRGCGIGPIGAFGYAICPKCNGSMTPVEEED